MESCAPEHVREDRICAATRHPWEASPGRGSSIDQFTNSDFFGASGRAGEGALRSCQSMTQAGEAVLFVHVLIASA